jgi:hypothetical protein
MGTIANPIALNAQIPFQRLQTHPQPPLSLPSPLPPMSSVLLPRRSQRRSQRRERSRHKSINSQIVIQES